MTNSSTRASNPWRTLVERIEKPITGLFLTLGLTAVAFPYLPAYSETPAATYTASSRATAAQLASTRTLSNGVYLYGQSAQPGQIGSQYMVFEVNQGQVVGAFYMPSSSFDCFYGNLQADNLALTIVDSYEQASYPYSVALEPTDSVATNGKGTVVPISPEGFHTIANLSENDRRILSTCKADHQNQNQQPQNQLHTPNSTGHVSAREVVD